jgi:hypothetical protein
LTTPPNFNDAAVVSVFDKIVSYALQSGRFDHVNQHEPKNGPGVGLICSVWVQSMRPTRSSGLAITSGVLQMSMRLYMNFRSEPYDMIDFNILTGALWLMAAYTGDFDFGNVANVRNVDVLGSEGTPLSSNAGYVEIDKTVYRVMTITLPIIINDMFIQVA